MNMALKCSIQVFAWILTFSPILLYSNGGLLIRLLSPDDPAPRGTFGVLFAISLLCAITLMPAGLVLLYIVYRKKKRAASISLKSVLKDNES
jgi:hypothetical protein